MTQDKHKEMQNDHIECLQWDAVWDKKEPDLWQKNQKET